MFDSHFPNIGENEKGTKYILKLLENIKKNIASIESMEVKMLESNALPFHFARKGTLRPYNSVQAYNSVSCQKYLILMSRGRNSKSNKVAKLVLDANVLSRH